MIILKVRNSSKYPAVSVSVDGEIFFYDVLIHSDSLPRLVPAGTSSVCVFDNHGKTILDLWLSFPPCADCLLEIFDEYAVIKNIRSF